jgi:hypothetical protein
VNTSVDQDAVLSLFREKKDLFGLVYKFNLMPAEYIHRTWIETFIPPILFEKITQSEKGTEKLSQWLLERFNLNNDYYYDFVDPLFRLALLPNDVISQITLYCGVALNYKNITAVIDKSKKEEIINNIGIESYRFGIRRAPLLLGNGKILAEPWSEKDDVKSHIQRYGAAYFLTSFARAPKSIFKRLILKFPKEICKNRDLFYTGQKESNQWLFLRRILKHAIGPTWQHLFS